MSLSAADCATGIPVFRQQAVYGVMEPEIGLFLNTPLQQEQRQREDKAVVGEEVVGDAPESRPADHPRTPTSADQ